MYSLTSKRCALCRGLDKDIDASSLSIVVTTKSMIMPLSSWHNDEEKVSVSKTVHPDARISMHIRSEDAICSSETQGSGFTTTSALDSNVSSRTSNGKKTTERTKLPKRDHVFYIPIPKGQERGFRARMFGRGGANIWSIVKRCPSAKIMIDEHKDDKPMRLHLSCTNVNEFEVAMRHVGALISGSFSQYF